MFRSTLQGESAHLAIVTGESTVLEYGMGEQVGGDHRDAQATRGEALLEACDDRVAFRCTRTERHEVVIVERDAPRTDFGELVDGVKRVEWWPGGFAEGVAGLPANGPHAEGELVGGVRSRAHRANGS